MKKRLLIFGTFGALAIAAVLGYRHFFLARPVGRGPAGPAVLREAFARPWTDRRVLLLGLGDSVTDGFGSTEGHSYFDHLVDIHAALLGHGIHCRQKWHRHYDAKDPHYWYFGNLEDPNDRGYDAIRRVFLIEMVKTLKP
ncbi:MAG: hypothetical protein HYY18_22035 [Planctomycetes bacterium]|nr:hypothetical protein [Planctomycetota bacterium]